jgi:4-hydroxybenzoate polyprenyltransferase
VRAKCTTLPLITYMHLHRPRSRFVFLIAGLARLGFITQFLSKPVMDGFVTGLAVFVVVGQLNKLFDVEISGHNAQVDAYNAWVQQTFGMILLSSCRRCPARLC